MGRNTRLRLVSPYVLIRALAASCVLYNRTEHKQGFFICLLMVAFYEHLTVAFYDNFKVEIFKKIITYDHSFGLNYIRVAYWLCFT